MSFTLNMGGSTLSFNFVAATAAGGTIIESPASPDFDEGSGRLFFMDVFFAPPIEWRASGSGITPLTTLAELIPMELAAIEGRGAFAAGTVIAQILPRGPADLSVALLTSITWGGLFDLGNDILRLTNGGDTIDAGIGRDSIVGNGGDDVLFGGVGPDTINGGNGADSILGEAANDRLLGGAGGDTLDGGGGRDTIFGQAAGDVLNGGGDRDFLRGGTGADLLNGGADADDLRGDSGGDTLIGGTGNDTLDGVGGADSLVGGAGNDTLFARSGNDTLEGGAGKDRMSGGIGNDDLDGGGGADRLFGDQNNDTLNGGAGNDRLKGGGGTDQFIYTTGTDRILDYDVVAGELIQIQGQGVPEDVDAFLAENSTTGAGFVTLEFGGSNRLIVFGPGTTDDLVLEFLA